MCLSPGETHSTSKSPSNETGPGVALLSTSLMTPREFSLLSHNLLLKGFQTQERTMLRPISYIVQASNRQQTKFSSQVKWGLCLSPSVCLPVRPSIRPGVEVI